MGAAIKVYSETGATIRSDVNNIWIAFNTVIENAQGGYGNDLLFGNDVNNILSGLSGNDTMSGGKGRDTLLASSGNDRLNGGLGSDSLTGGDGRDVFIFNTSVTAGVNVDRIASFIKGQDRLELDNAIFSGLRAGALNSSNFATNAAGKAQDANDFIIYETDTGKLFYDADGTGGGAAVQFAIVGNRPALTTSDFLIV
jgi:serralysin